MRESPIIHLIAPLVDQGLNYFLTHYSSGIDQPPFTSQAYHHHLATNGFHPLVATTMTALGIAGVGNLYMDSNLKREATRWYLKAIRMANAAISSPEQVKEDSTLVAVNLLSMFEATFNDKSLVGWSNHVDGASLLVKMRGMNQFSTAAGRRMYLHTIGLLTMNCMGQGIPMPEYVRQLNSELTQYLNIDDPRNAFFFLHIKTADLRAQILNHTAIDLESIIESALELDRIALSIFEGKDDDWHYDIVPCDTAGVFGDSYHVYPTHATAQTWNWVRYNRIYFHDIIRNSILAGFATSPPILVGSKYVELLGHSTQTLLQIQSDILASMPQFLHDTPKEVPMKVATSDSRRPRIASNMGTSQGNVDYECVVNPLFTPPTTPGSRAHSPIVGTPSGPRKAFFQNFRNDSMPLSNVFKDNGSVHDRLPIVRISGGYSTLWALYVAGSMPTASPSSQDYVLQCFGRIEREFGINQAKVLANALTMKRGMINGGETTFGICPQYLPPDGEPYIPPQGSDRKTYDPVPSPPHAASAYEISMEGDPNALYNFLDPQFDV
ncbi:hypothetical protein FB567DRAFT_237164 [Paraphoma chrysanthemicola]|uniref:Transcription factor domain-containing protein n=1 Tax=Paraphoma chrysanthemicola TaxID=798071 RepID=A0A8K0W3E8_9PLEO|nr:hypothetical protein FB567DRAFT_237164 [Paraphoma chrysanthemicola]